MQLNASLVVLSRLSAAVIGGYGLSLAIALLLSLLLPLPKAEALLTALMVSFVVYPCLILRAYSLPNHRRLWCELIVSIGLCLLLAAILNLLTAS